MSIHRINVENGKYTFNFDGTKTLYVFSDGAPLVTVSDMPPNAIGSIMAELDAARVVLQAARSIPAADSSPSEIIAFFDRMRDAVTKHNHLCDDRELPSDWTK